MPYRVRKPMTVNGRFLRPNDVLPNLDEFHRPEGLIRTGYVVEIAEPPAPVKKAAPAKKAPAKKAVAEDESDA